MKYYFFILKGRINDLNLLNQTSKIDIYNSILDCLKYKMYFTELKIKEYTISLQPFSSNLSEIINYLFKKEIQPHDRFIYRLNLFLLRFNIFYFASKMSKSDSKKFDTIKTVIFETVQNIEEYIKLPIEIL